MTMQRSLIPISVALALTACAGGLQPEPDPGTQPGTARFAPYDWVGGSTDTAGNDGNARRHMERRADDLGEPDNTDRR